MEILHESSMLNKFGDTWQSQKVTISPYNTTFPLTHPILFASNERSKVKKDFDEQGIFEDRRVLLKGV